MAPACRSWLEPVVVQQPPSVPRHQPDRGDHIVEDRRRDEVVEVFPHPAGFDPFEPPEISRRVAASVEVDAQQWWPYGPAHEQPPRAGCRTGRSAAPPRSCGAGSAPGRPNHERHDRQPSAVRLPSTRSSTRPTDAASPAPGTLLGSADRVDADRLLELEHQPGPDRLDDRRRPPSSRCAGSSGSGGRRVDKRDGATAQHSGDPVGEQLTTSRQGCPACRAADELVRGEEDRVLVGHRVLVPPGVHVDVDVRRCGGEVPEGQGAVLVEQRGDRRRCR